MLHWKTGSVKFNWIIIILRKIPYYNLNKNIYATKDNNTHKKL